MTNKLIFLLAFLLVVAPAIPARAEIAANQTTAAGEFNGRFWQTLTFSGKLGFVLGFAEGFTSGYSSAEPPSPKEPPIRSGATHDEINQYFDQIDEKVKARFRKKAEADPMPDGQFGDTVRALDKFYEQAELLPFPIVAAMNILKVRFAGKPQVEIDRLIDIYRRAYIEGPRVACAEFKLFCDKL